MKIRRVQIENFKGVKALDISLESPDGVPRALTTLIGDNGSGKTTVLQAIALTLSLATRRTREPSALAWHGFLAERVSSLGPTRVEIQVSLLPEEVATTRRLFQWWYHAISADWRETHRIVPPSDHLDVTLVYDDGRLTSPQGFEALNQFLGRYYVKALLMSQTVRREMFADIGDVFWFDQHRNLGSVMMGRDEKSREGAGSIEGWTAGVEQLREFLVGWWAYHKSPPRTGGKDYIVALEERFAEIFPGTHFHGAAPRESVAAPRARDFYFLLERDGKLYDLAEMSSGEQAVFPLLYEFVRLDIARSVVLVDELELHLHPPQQQALLAALPRLGPDCQFVISTHSPYLENIVPTDFELRLPGGQPSL